MPTEPKTACVEDFSGDSDTGRTKPGTKISANIQKEEKKSKKEPKREKERSHRKQRRPESDGGTILDVEQTDDLVASFKHLRVLPDPEESRRKPANSAPVNGGHSPKKSSRPAPPQGVTFDPPISSRHDRNDKRYFGRTKEEVRVSTTKARPQSIPQHMRPTPPARPQSYHAGFPPHPSQSPHYPPLFAQPTVAYPAATIPFAAMPRYENPNYAGPPPVQNRLADRFGLTGKPTLNTQPLPHVAPPRRSEEAYAEDDYESESDEPAYDPRPLNDDRRRQERERKSRAERATQRLLEEQARENRALKDRVLDEVEYRRQKRKLDRARAEQEREDRELMPPPDLPRPGAPRKQSSQRSRRESRVLPELSYPSIEDIREESKRHSYDRRGSSSSDVRPPFFKRETDPTPRARRPSQTRASPSFASTGHHRDLPYRDERLRPELQIPGRRDRRDSTYNGSLGTAATSTESSNYEDSLIDDAVRYQDEISGATPALTTEMLQKQQRRIKAGSRSTHSSVSKDESDMKQSITTRTTRSGSGDGIEGHTLVINGNAKVKIGGAEINTREADGAVELTFQANDQPRRQIRNGSEASFATSGISGTTAASENIRPKPSRRDSVNSHRPRSSVDDSRYPPRAGEQKHQNLINRMNPSPIQTPIPLGRQDSNRRRGYQANHIDYERERGGYFGQL